MCVECRPPSVPANNYQHVKLLLSMLYWMWLCEGAMYDQTHDNNVPFEFCGAMMFTGGVLSCCLHLPWFWRRARNNVPDMNNLDADTQQEQFNDLQGTDLPTQDSIIDELVISETNMPATDSIKDDTFVTVSDESSGTLAGL